MLLDTTVHNPIVNMPHRLLFVEIIRASRVICGRVVLRERRRCNLVSVMVGHVLVVQVRVRPVVGGGELPGALGADGARLALLLLAPAAAAAAAAASGRAHVHAYAALQEGLETLQNVLITTFIKQ